MKKLKLMRLVSFLITGLLLAAIVDAQNVEFKLGGSKKTNYFVIKNSKDKVLLKVRGNGLLNTKNSMNLDGYNYSYQIQNNDVLRIDKNENTYVGIAAGKNNVSGTGNTCSGYNAGIATTGNYNTFTGSWAGEKTTIGARNAFYGRKAGFFNITGNYNTYIGYAAGYNSTGSDNVFLGYYAGYSETGSNLLYIDNSNATIPLIWGDFANDRVVIDGNSTHNTSNRTFFSNGAAGGTGAWNNDSDGRKKKNIATINQALDKVQNLRGVNFEWKETEHHEEGLQMGFIAQEVEAVIPEVVSNGGDSYSMQYSPLTALLVEATKEQQSLINNQTELLNSQQQIIDDLKVRVQTLENQQQLAEVR